MYQSHKIPCIFFLNKTVGTQKESDLLFYAKVAILPIKKVKIMPSGLFIFQVGFLHFLHVFLISFLNIQILWRLTALTPLPPMLFEARGHDALLIMPCHQKLSIRTFFWGIVCFCTSNGSFRILKKARENFSKIDYFHNFLKWWKL